MQHIFLWPLHIRKGGIAMKTNLLNEVWGQRSEDALRFTCVTNMFSMANRAIVTTRGP